MLITIFKSVLLMSAVGAALCVVLLCLKPITRKLFSPKWQYYIWLTVLIVMIVPVRFTMPHRMSDIKPIQSAQNVAVDMETAVTENQTSAYTEQFSEIRTVPKINLPRNIMWYLSIIWCLGVTAVLLAKTAKYLIFLRTIYKNSYADNTILSIPKRLCVRRTQMLDAPLIIGLIKSVLYLPDVELTENDMNYILMHELTHYKRHDILYKWFAMTVQCVHWFNPLIYAVSKQIDLECEISCDAAVTSRLSEQEQNNYMNMILDMLISSKSKQRPLTTQMASSKKILKRRFTMIRNKKKTSKFVSVISVIIAVVMLGTTVFASGVLSGLTTDTYTVEITNNGEKIELANKPFIENGEVYVPLRETVEKIIGKDNSDIVWNNDMVYLTIRQANGLAGLYRLKIGEPYTGLMHIDSDEIFTAISQYSNDFIIGIISQDGITILSNGTTYLPIGDLNYILFGFLNMRDENNNLCELTAAVYDKSGNLISSSFGPIDDKTAIATIENYPDKQEKCYEITNKFFTAFENGDINAMKQCGTDKFNSYYFHKDEFLSMKSGTLETVYSIRVFTNGQYYVHLCMSSDDLSEETEVFFAIFEEQPNGDFLLNDFQKSYKDEWKPVL